MRRRSPIDVADGALGQVVERLTRSHHRRRLRRVGASAAIDPGPGLWAGGDPPPRAGNAFDVLIDGADALQAMARAIAEARSSVHITGWHITPDFAMTRGERPTIVRQLLADVATRIPVRVLIWAGAPVPALRPWRGDLRKVREQLMAGTRIRCALDARERPMHCHHEKTIVVDGRIALQADEPLAAGLAGIGAAPLPVITGPGPAPPGHACLRGRGGRAIERRSGAGAGPR